MTSPSTVSTRSRSNSGGPPRSAGPGDGSMYSIAASTPTVLNTRRVTLLKKVCASSASGRPRAPRAWRERMAAHRVRSMTASCRMSCTSATAPSTCVR